MSRGTERNYRDPVTMANYRLNSTLNAEDASQADKETLASTAVAGTTQGLTAKANTDLNADYVKLKLFKNNKPLAHYKSRNYNASDAADFVAEVEDEFVTTGVSVSIDDNELIVDQDLGQLEVLAVEYDGENSDVIADATFESSDTDLATVDGDGVVTPVITGITYATQTLTSDATAPSDGDTVTIAGVTYTFKTALSEAKATATLTSDATAPDAADTVTVGAKTYTFVTALTEAYATATLTSDATAPADGDTVTIGATTYTFQDSLVDEANNVLVGADAAASLDNLKSAVNASAGAGSTYGTGTVANASVTATTNTDTTQLFVAKTLGTSGNSIAKAEDSTHLDWDGVGATFTGGVAAVANEVLIGADAAAALDNLKSAVNGTAGVGTTYSTGTTANASVLATTNTDTTQVFEALSFGTAGNSIAKAEDSDHLDWDGAGAVFTGGVDIGEGEVLIGASAAAALDNLKSAINDTGTEGTHYATNTTAHTLVEATTNTDTTQVVQSREAGLNGNLLAVSENSSHLSWGAATLSGATTDEVTITVTYTTPTAVEYTQTTLPIRIIDVVSVNASATDSTLTHPATDQMVVTATYSDNTTADVTGDCEYASDAEGDATVSESGLVTTVSSGTPTITVTYGDEEDTVQYTIS